jgi:hypothetical protein
LNRGWRLEAGGWRLEAGGWRLEAGGWRLEAGRDPIQQFNKSTILKCLSSS